MKKYITQTLTQKASKGQNRAKENRNKELVKIKSETHDLGDRRNNKHYKGQSCKNSNKTYKALASLVKCNIEKEQIYDKGDINIAMLAIKS